MTLMLHRQQVIVTISTAIYLSKLDNVTLLKGLNQQSVILHR